VSRGGGLRTCGTYNSNHTDDTDDSYNANHTYDSLTARRQGLQVARAVPIP